MKVSLKKIGRGLCFVLMLALVVANVSAQQSATGTLRGQISDEFGGVIVGATVMVVDAAGKQKTATTDADGNFAVAALAPGKYTVRAIAAGFAFYEATEVDVTPGSNQALKITLGVSLDKEEVTVASEGPINLDSSSAGAVVLKGKDLEALPDDPDELAAALSALAGPAAGPNGGQILIDGFEGGRIPPKDSIREIRINDNPLSAENDRPGFGGIQIFTKPGTDKLRGSVYSTFNDESFNSRNPLLRQAKRPPFQNRQIGGNLSGTIVPKKSSFFLDFDRVETDDNDLVNATILDPASLQPLGFNAAVLTPIRRLSFSPRVDYSFNNSNTLVARYSYFKTEQKNVGVSQFSLPERAFDTEFHQHQLQLTETAILNPTTINETRFQFIRSRTGQTALSDALAINVLEAFSQGGATVGNSFNESTRWEVTNTTTKAHGLHSIKFGGRLRGIHVSDFSESNFNGTFTFSSLDQYRATLLGQPGAFPTQLSIAGGEPLTEISQVDFGGFVQDDWKVRPNLTIGGGVRYEAQTNISSGFNFAPRVYLAWSPDTTAQKQGKTAIRLGFGLFYDRISENFSLQQLRFNGINQQQYIIVAPLSTDTSASANQARSILSQFPNIPTVDQLTGFALPQATRQLADDAVAPYSYITGLIVTRQLTKTTTLNLFASTYNTRHALRQRNINAPLGAGLGRPRPELGDIYEYETSGTINNKQLNISLSKQFSRAVSITANYTLSKSEGDTDFGFPFPVNQYDLSGEYGRSSFDTRHRLFVFGSLGIPYLKLSLNPMIIANTGRPFNITTGLDNNRDGIFNDRPALADAQTRPCAPGQRPAFSDCDLVQTALGNFDLHPKPGQQIIPRNSAEGPGFFSLNLRVGRTFGFGDLPGAAERRQAAQQQQQQQGGGNRGGGGNNRGGAPGGGGGARPGGGAVVQPGVGGGMMVMMGAPGGNEQKRYSLNFALNFINLLNHTNLSNPVGNLSSNNFGQSLFAIGGGFGGGGNQAAGNRRIQASVRFSF